MRVVGFQGIRDFGLLVVLTLCAPLQPQAQGTSAPPITAIANSVRSGDFDQALQLSHASLERDPRDYRVWTLRGMAYAGTGNLSSALEAYQHALKLSADYLPALEGAAQTEYQQGNPGAKSLLLQVLAQRPDDATSHTMLGFVEYAANHCAEALPHFEQGGVVIASQPSALAAYGACEAQLGHYEQAIPLFQRALAADPSNQKIRFNTAVAQWKADLPKDALATLQTGIDAGNSDSVLLAAEIHESMNDTQAAIDLLRGEILANPKNVAGYLDFAFLSYDHQSLQVGIDILNAGLTQLPKEARLYLARGVLYAESGKPEEATADFETANHLDAHLSFLGAAEGIEASQQHKSKEALARFRAAAKAQPHDALTQFLLAEALSAESPAEGSAEYTEEINAAKLACKLDPSLVAAHDLLATIYLQQGHNELAIEESRASLAADAKDQQALYHLILALRKSGQKDKIAEPLAKLTALRNAAQADMAQNKRYQLQEIPAATSPR